MDVVSLLMSEIFSDCHLERSARMLFRSAVLAERRTRSRRTPMRDGSRPPDVSMRVAGREIYQGEWAEVGCDSVHTRTHAQAP